MVYSEEEIFALEAAAENNAHIADRDQDIKPRFHKGKTHELAGEKEGDKPKPAEDNEEESDYDDDDDLDDDVADEWNIRKCSAASVDMLSSVFGDDLLDDLLPSVQQMLSANEWQVKEAGILALGAVAQGATSGMVPHLPQLIPHLIVLLSHEKPLIRSITCWTLGRYISWIVNPPPEVRADHAAHQQHFSTYFLPLLQGILAMCVDNNKEVQKSGCSTLAIIEEEAGETLVPYLPHIVETIAKAFGFYQKKNLLVLYDAFSTLAESVGPALNQPQFIQQFMPPLLQKWSSVPDEDYDLFPLLECLSSVSVALGQGFFPYAEPVWNRAINIIKNTIISTQQFNAADATLMMPDKDFMVVALDLLSGIVQGLGPHASSLINQSGDPNLYQLLKYTMRDETPDVRSSSFALLGDLAMSCFSSIIPHLNDIMVLIVHNLGVVMDSQALSAMNNAAWSAGEIAIKHLGNMEPYVQPLLSKLLPILLGNQTARSLKENSAITIGRLALACPQQVAPYLGNFIQRWCEALNLVHDNAEKASAFQGICKVIRLNPNSIVPYFGSYCDAVLKWNVSNLPELHQMFLQVSRPASH
ncbi:hypothetical protein HDV03_001704 [Kappamyces sp. JEL0829]|nr:hypothetical protein HDV03_001704 [Kappamyces sp. JEL0829]